MTVIWWPGLLSPADVPRWAALSIVVPLLVFWTAPKLVGWHFALAATLLWASASIWWSLNAAIAFGAWWKLAILSLLVMLGATISTPRPIFIGIWSGIVLNGLLAIGQAVGVLPIPIDQAIGPAGLLVNKNFLGELSALGIALALGTKSYRWLPWLLIPLGLTHCRGAILATFVVSVCWLWRYSRTMAVLTGLLGVNLAIVYWQGRGFDYTASERLKMLLDTLPQLTLWGAGIGSFVVEYPGFNALTDTLASRPEHLHNDALELIFELGLGATPLLGLVGAAFLRAPHAIQLGLLAVAICSLVGFPLSIPSTAVPFALLIGHCLGLRPSLRGRLGDERMASRRRPASWRLREDRARG